MPEGGGEWFVFPLFPFPGTLHRLGNHSTGSTFLPAHFCEPAPCVVSTLLGARLKLWEEKRKGEWPQLKQISLRRGAGCRVQGAGSRVQGPKNFIGQKRELLWWKFTSANLFFEDSGPRQKCSFFFFFWCSYLCPCQSLPAPNFLQMFSLCCWLAFFFLVRQGFLSSSEALCF